MTQPPAAPAANVLAHELTIVVPCLEEVDELRACLASLAAVLPGQRVVVVKMGSWPAAAVAGYDLDMHLLPAPRMCAAAARNLGAQQVLAGYIFFLDSDCVLRGEPDAWQRHLAAALAARPDLVVLQRGEVGRTFGTAAPTRWNFPRHCIEWNLIWSRECFYRLGGLDELCGTGSPTLAQSGEAFAICYAYFATPGVRTVYLPQLVVEHPFLGYRDLAPRKQFEYAYGYSFIAMRPLRRQPSLLALFWFVRTLGGLAADVQRAWRARSAALLARLLLARLLATWDALRRERARPRYGRP